MRAAYLIAAASFFSFACHDPPAPPVDAAPEASSPASHPSFLADPNGPPGGDHPAPPHREAGNGDAGLQKCRVMDADNGPPASSDPSTWITLTSKGTFNVRVFETGRDLRFEGPGRFKACGGDVALVVLGSAIGLPGSGEAPGSEQWVATACGAARWASGVHRFAATPDACRLQVSMGTLDFWLPGDVTAEDAPMDAGAPMPEAGAGDSGVGAGWHHVGTRRAYRFAGRLVDVKASLGECDAAATEVASLAKRMAAAAAGNTGELGAMAAQSVTTRGTARAACAVAAVRVAIAGDKPDDRARLDAANARFRGAP